jgi:hypothetical protein
MLVIVVVMLDICKSGVVQKSQAKAFWGHFVAYSGEARSRDVWLLLITV